MELEYQLAELIAKAKTNDQWGNAMSAFEVTSFRLSIDEKERILKLLEERNEAILNDAKSHLELAFAIRKDFGIQNNIKPSIRIYEPQSVEEAAEGLTVRTVNNG
jgi:hypothetical protein